MGGSFLSRTVGVLLLAVTIGLGSCQALFDGPPGPADGGAGQPARTDGG